MSFLQPILLAAIPLIGLPLLIHLVNQRRYQTMPWAAMKFVLAANRMSRGFARLRQWLILAVRMLVIAGLIFALARPLASGWLGLTVGSKTDTTIILLDRSPSMATAGNSGLDTKLDTGLRHLAESLEKLGSDHWVLIDSATVKPLEIQSPNDLLASSVTDPVGSSANFPAMFRAAYEYMQSNQTGRTDVWVCSDMRSHDWEAEGGQWPAIRQSFIDLPQAVRFYLLAFPEESNENTSLRVTEVSRKESDQGASLLVSLAISRQVESEEPITLPVEFAIDGARSVVQVEMKGRMHELRNHEIPLGVNQVQGWGQVSIPADSNLLDNEFYFVFDEAPVRKTLLVTEDSRSSRALQLAAEIGSAPNIKTLVEVTSPAQINSVVWEEVGLVLWQAPLPSEKNSELLRSYVEQEGSLLLFPPRAPSKNSLFGFSWKEWKDIPEEILVDSWRGDADLLARTQNGSALPVGELRVHRSCVASGEITPLAKLSNGDLLLGRLPTAKGKVYALTTTSNEIDSSLASDGVMLYVMIQRSLANGSKRLGRTRQQIAGFLEEDSSDWECLRGSEFSLSDQYAMYSGVYKTQEKLLALNREVAEDVNLVLTAEQTDRVMEGFDWVRLDSQASEQASLVNEIWRLFLVAMLVALLLESALCLPKAKSAARDLA